MGSKDSRGSHRPRATRGKNVPASLHNGQYMVLALMESAAQAIIGADRDGKIVLANRKTEEMFGYTREELIGSRIEMLLPESQRSAHEREREEYFARPRVRPMGVGMELAGRRKDASEFPVEVSLSHIDTQEGLFAIAFVSDISQRKRLEEQLVHAQKMEAVGRLAGGVAHDFNNMLTVISGYNRMILDDLSPLDPLRGNAEEILKAADRAAALGLLAQVLFDCAPTGQLTGADYVSENLSDETYVYDANGNLTNDGLRSFKYDDENQLASVGFCRLPEERFDEWAVRLALPPMFSTK